MEDNVLKSEGRTGEITFLRALNKYEFAVEIRVMREGLNNNKWDYRNLDKYYLSFLGQPILIAYVGQKIGDGHNMREVRLPDGGKEYTFVDGTAERIIGVLSDNKDDFRTEEINGQLWMIAKGRIFSFYAREAVEKIRVTGTMDVSAETEIYEMEESDNGVEIFTNWAGLGVTILGDDVPPAIPGARIKAMSVRDDLEGMKLRAASLLQEADETPRTETKKKGVNNGMNKRQIAHLQKQFAGYTVLKASDDGMRVCLASEETGAPYGYVFKDEEDKSGVIPERIFPMRVDASFAFDSENKIDVDVESIIDGISAKLIAANADIEEKTKKIAELEEKVKVAEEKEQKRRISDAKKAVLSRLDALNKDRDARCAYGKELADKVCERAEKGCFNECMEDGEWCGDRMACMELEALCAQKQAEFDAEAKAKKNQTYSWNELVKGENPGEEHSTDELLAWVNAQ